ncbi:hypothetical protein AYO49_01900 [Verrucomicrobiaceae bacterium SCGC AG-212-N21]|nr:hypothetical protein AYO49_01900 [Verrucomicrobiaceae bacterium SCGC AG-212-N21]
MDRYYVLAKSSEDAPAWHVIMPDEASSPHEVRLVSRKPMSITWQIKDAAGKPLEGVRAELMGGGESDGDYPRISLERVTGLAHAVSDASGKVTLSGLPRTLCELRFTHKSGMHVTWAGFDSKNPDHQNEDLAFDPGVTISGRVADPQGRGVAGARVWFHIIWQFESYHYMFCARTDAEGRYRIPGVFGPGRPQEENVGKYRVWVEHSKFSAEPRVIEVKSGQDIGNLDFLAKEGTLVRGKFLGLAGGKPLGGTLLEMWNDRARYLRTTDAQGGYEACLPQGRYHVSIDRAPRGFWFEEENVSVEIAVEGRELVFDIAPRDVAQKIATVSGRVLRPDGSPASDATINVSSHQQFLDEGKHRGLFDDALRTDKNGDFVLPRGPSQGKLLVQARLNNNTEVGSVEVPLREGKIELEAPLQLRRTIPVNVLLTDFDGKPRPNTTVQVTLPDADGGAVRVKSDGKGFATLAGIVPGVRYQIEDTRNGIPLFKTFAEGDTQRHTLVLSDRYVIRVVDAEGRTVPFEQWMWMTYWGDDGSEFNAGPQKIEKTLPDGAIVLKRNLWFWTSKRLVMEFKSKGSADSVRAEGAWPSDGTNVLLLRTAQAALAPDYVEAPGIATAAGEVIIKLVDEKGAPAADVPMRWLPVEENGEAKVRTDAQGLARLTPPEAPNDYTVPVLRIESSGHSVRWLSNPPKGKALLVTLDRATRLKGRFMAPDGSADAGRCIITLQRYKAEVGEGRRHRVSVNLRQETDATGAYDFPIEPGEYSASIYSEKGPISYDEKITVNPGQVTALPERLRAPVTFRMRLVHADTGRPVAGMSVAAMQGRPASSGFRTLQSDMTQKSDADGWLTWAGMAEGETSFQLDLRGGDADGVKYGRAWSSAAVDRSSRPMSPGSAGNFGRGSPTFRVSSQSSSVTMQLEPAMRVHGRLTKKDGSPALGRISLVSVHVWPGGGMARSFSIGGGAQTDAEGRYDAWFPAGNGTTYHLLAVPMEDATPAARFANAVSKPFASKSGDNIEVNLIATAGMTVNGRVVDPDKKPMTGVEIQLVSTSALEPEQFISKMPTYVEGNIPGAFQFTRVRADTYHVIAYRRVPPSSYDQVEIARNVVVQEDKDVHLGDLTLKWPTREAEANNGAAAAPAAPVPAAPKVVAAASAPALDPVATPPTPAPAPAATTNAAADSISGIVVDEKGQPVADAKIEARVFRTRDKFKKSVLPEGYKSSREAVKSDAQGRWKVPDVPMGVVPETAKANGEGKDTYRLTITHPEFLAREFNSITKLLGTDEEFRNGTAKQALERGHVMRGVVRDESGKPIAGATIQRNIELDDPQAKTDAEGRYELKAARPGDFVMRVRAEGFALHQQRLPLSQDTTLDFILKPAKTLTFKLRDEQGLPVSAGYVNFMPPAKSWKKGDRLWWVYPDKEGVVTWKEAPATEIVASVNMDDYLPEQKKLTAGEETVITLKAKKAFPVITLKVTSAATGKLLPGCTVNTGVMAKAQRRDMRGDPSWLEKETGEPMKMTAEGEYIGKIPEHYQDNLIVFCVRCEGHAPVITEPLDPVEGNKTVTVSLHERPPATVMVQGADGAPVGKANVYVQWQERSIYLRAFELKQTRNQNAHVEFQGLTTADGRCTLPPCADNASVLVTHESGFAKAVYADLAKEGSIKLQPYGRVEGTVKTKGKPVSGVAYEYQGNPSLNDQRYVVFIDHAVSDAQGRIELPRVFPCQQAHFREELPTGSERGSAYNLAAKEYKPVAGGETTTFELETKSAVVRTVKGRFVVRGGGELAMPERTHLPLWLMNSEDGGAGFSASSDVDSDGIFEFNAVLPGKHHLLIPNSNGQPGRYAFPGTRNYQVVVPPPTAEDAGKPYDLGDIELVDQSKTAKLTPPEGKALYRFVVQDQSGKPVAGAKITFSCARLEANRGACFGPSVFGDAKEFPSGKTNAQGILEIQTPAQADNGSKVYAMSTGVAAEGYIAQPVAADAPINSETVFKLEPAAKVSVRLLHEGRPVLDHAVILSGGEVPEYGALAFAPDAAGQCLTNHQSPTGHRALQAAYRTPEGSLVFSSVITTELKTGENPIIEAPLQPGLRLSGRLSDDVPRPVKDARIAVYVTRPDGGLIDKFYWTDWTTVREDGAFEFASVPAGRVRFLALMDGWSSPFKKEDGMRNRPWSAGVLTQSRSDLVVPMERTASCEVTVVDVQGKPLPGAQVHASPNFSPDSWGNQMLAVGYQTLASMIDQDAGARLDVEATWKRFVVTTDEQGRATIHGIPASMAPESISGYLPGTDPAKNYAPPQYVQVEDLKPGGTVKVTLKLEP